MSTVVQHLIAFLAAALFSIVLTPLVRRAAIHFNFIAKPKADRWHTKPTAMLGGIAIFLSYSIAFLIFFNSDREILALVGCASCMFLIGLYDDIRDLKPHVKLIGQILVALALIKFGFILQWTGITGLDIIITLLWIVGITNAFNLLDNMDGLSAGIALIASLFCYILFLLCRIDSMALTTAIFAGTLLGFLFYNFNPASIFMGDSGSLFLGLMMSGLTLGGVAKRYPLHVGFILFIPVLILIIPIFDTSLVTIMRRFNGKAISQGGRDHTSHRLVTLGFSERKAVIILYILAAFSGIIAMLVRMLHREVGFFIVPLFLIVLALISVYLGRVNVYYSKERLQAERSKHPITVVLTEFTYKRRIFEILLDIGLIVLAYYGAYILRFEGRELQLSLPTFLHSLPIIIACKVLSLQISGVYRGVWRYASVSDFQVFFRATALGSLLALVICFLIYRLEGFSRSVFLIDWLLLFTLLFGARFSFRIFHFIARSHSTGGERILIYGAGDGGELALRELINNQDLALMPVGFLDDDPMKRHVKIHGLPVLGDIGQIEKIILREEISKVLVSCRSLQPKNRDRLIEVCERHNVNINRITIEFTRLPFPTQDLSS